MMKLMEQNVFDQNSQTQNTRSRLPLFILIGFGIFIFGFLIGAAIILSIDQKEKYSVIPSYQTPTNTQPSLTKDEIRRQLGSNQPILPSDEIVYIKNGDIYLVGKEKRQLTQGKNATHLRSSQDGKYVGWIDNRHIQVTSTDSQNLPSGAPSQSPVETSVVVAENISVISLNSSTLQPVFSSPSNEELKSIQADNERYAERLSGFDFYPQDSTKIVYAKDGIWVIDLTSKQTQKILNNDSREKRLSGGGASYVDVKSNPKFAKLLLAQSMWETNGYSVYDLQTKTNTSIRGDNLSCNDSFWSHDGMSVYSYSTAGYCYGGVWITTTKPFSTQSIIEQPRDKEAGLVSVNSLTETIDGKLLGLIIPWGKDGPQEKLEAIYDIQPQKESALIKQLPETFMISTSPRSRLLGYLTHCKNNSDEKQHCELHIADLDTFNDVLIDSDVAEFLWQP